MKSNKTATNINSGFNEVIHAPNRLQICALLSALAEVEFQALRDQLEVSDSVLSKHLKKLDEAGFIAIRKEKIAGRQRMWVSLNEQGLTAFQAHVAALNAIVGLG